jgi:hypothetical protein
VAPDIRIGIRTPGMEPAVLEQGLGQQWDQDVTVGHPRGVGFKPWVGGELGQAEVVA